MAHNQPKFDKLEKLLRFHRQHVFDERYGDAHGRAIARLKRTKTFKALCQHNVDLASIRLGERLTRQGY